MWIPIECSKNVVFWRTRAPKVKEINDPTRDQPWVPSKMTSILSKEEEERTRLMKSVKIIRRLVASLNPSEPHVPFGSKEFDVLLTSCSPVYTESGLAQCLVSSVGWLLTSIGRFEWELLI